MASVASLWELYLKAGRKNALVGDPLAWWRKYVINNGVFKLSIRTQDVIALCSLAEIHRDPFDRILVAQSLSERIPLITKERKLALYGTPIIW